MTEEPRPEKIRVTIDPQIKGLVPRFLENTRKKAAMLTEALTRGDWVEIRSLGHQLKGSGGVYGFDRITEIGQALEQAAEASDADGIRRQVEALVYYLDHVEIA
jgi:HPt (histidine-containing phosphotransfer) domain-containing protein